MAEEFRFAFGNPSAQRSAVWKVWIHNESIYLTSRMFGGNYKVSLHASGLCQASYTDIWVKRNVSKIKGNSSRHHDRWRPKLLLGAATLLFRVVVPASELGFFNESESLADIHWLAEPAAGQSGNVNLYLTPPKLDSPFAYDYDLPGAPLAIYQLKNKKWLVALVRYEHMQESHCVTLRDTKAAINMLCIHQQIRSNQSTVHQHFLWTMTNAVDL